MARYVWAVDSLDPEGYVAVFTEDAFIADFAVAINRSPEKTRPSDWNWLLPECRLFCRNIGSLAGMSALLAES